MKQKVRHLLLVGVVIIAAIFACFAFSLETQAAAKPVEKKAVIRELKESDVITAYFQGIEYEELNNKALIESKIRDLKNYEFTLESLINSKRYKEGREVVKAEITRIEDIISTYEKDIEEIIAYEEEQKRIEAMWAQKSSEYPVATTIWRYMKDNLGWNDSVCAGVIGNMMTEAGGQTLNIQPGIYGGSFYGICQWSSSYYPSVIGTDLNTQLNFLKETVQYEINTYGRGYGSFCSIQNPEEAALEFARSYERCASGSYGIRQTNARKAYNYFTN